MSKDKLIKQLRQLAVEPVYDPDWDGVSGTFNVDRLADFIIEHKGKS
jgi:hypothetical protein